MQAVTAAVAALIAPAVLGGPAVSWAGPTGSPAIPSGCAAGAQTLAEPGAILYPEVGNGGYVSVRTATHTVHDARTDRFLPGNRVDLTDRATECLTSLSVDFEPTAPGDPVNAPRMRVQSVFIDGVPASFRFAQPTYPGDPHGPDDPDPRAHEASQHDPVGGPDRNPLPPACSPELPRATPAGGRALHRLLTREENSRNGTQCPADKLVITPTRPIGDGTRFTIRVDYTGAPGVHHDADGSAEGWFRTADGDWTESEPLGSEDWMPLNDVPRAKPTYDFSITTNRGRTAIANGERVRVTRNPPDREFPNGSTTTVWHAPMGIASYLVTTIVGDDTSAVHRVAGRRYYVFQRRAISPRERAVNARTIAGQPGVTRGEARLAGPFPFPADGYVVGGPDSAGGYEETEAMIDNPGSIVPPGILAHETFHQWFGDSVSEADFSMAFFKEGMATLAETIFGDPRILHLGGLGTAPGRAAAERALVRVFDAAYRAGPGAWQLAPSCSS